MNTRLGAVLLVCGALLAACGNVDDLTETSSALESSDAQGPPEPPLLGAHRARDVGTWGSSALMTWHAGAIMPSAVVTVVFWGAKWTDSTFIADKITGLDSFYRGYGGSDYARASTEYTGSNGQVGAAISYAGHLVDASSVPAQGPSVLAVQAEVCKMVSSPLANGYYPVYVDTPRRSADFCAWHSYGSCGSVPIQFGFFFNLDGDAGCDPQDGRTAWSQGLEALANVSAHEVSETMTDPRGGGWYDSGGNENADKCAWTFNVPFVALSNGSTWRLQGEWSNVAFRSGTGYPNASGQRGCLSGK